MLPQVVGNYFDHALAPSEVAYSKQLRTRAPAGAGSGAVAGATGNAAPPVLLRRWTLGEVVTAVADAGLRVVVLEEEPGAKLDDGGLPKVFTLVAAK